MYVVDVGTPPSGFLSGFLARDSKLIAFHGFAGLPTKIGRSVKSPKFTCFGRQWVLQVYPGGHDEKGMIGVFLSHMSSGSVSVRYSFTVKDARGDTVAARDKSLDTTFVGPSDCGWGYSGYAKRSSVMKALVKGALLVEVRMKLLDQGSLPFIPKNPASNILSTFLGEPADIVFEVDKGQERPKTRSSFGASHVKFHGHEHLVEKYAPKMLDDKVPGTGLGVGDVAQVSVSNLDPSVFALVLRYIYGGKLADKDLKEHSKEIIEAAERYEMASLKLTAETWYVQTAQVNEATLEEHLIFAKTNNLALLKEAAVDFIIESGFETDNLPEKAQKGLLGDIQRATNKNAGRDKFSTMRVSELRKRLEEKGLDIGGSKKKMIDALREAAKSDEEVDACAANLGKMKV